MPRLNFRQRGQASLIALAMASWLALVVMGQYHAVRIPLAGESYGEVQRKQALAYEHAYIDVLLQNPIDWHGEGDYDYESYRWKRGEDSTEDLRVRALDMRFYEHEGWPQQRVLVLTGDAFLVFVRDFE